MIHCFRYLRAMLPVLAVVMALGGCQSGGPWIRYQPEPSTPAPPAGAYLDFNDVQIPAGLKLDRIESYVYQTEALKVGVLSLTTSRPIPELVVFFQENMARDNWRQVSAFSFRKTVLLFEKEGKNCLVLMQPSGEFKQFRVEIWVSPADLKARGRDPQTRR